MIRILQSIRRSGVAQDARAVRRIARRVLPTRTRSDRKNFWWMFLRWTLCTVTALLAMQAFVQLVAGNLIESVGWVALAFVMSRIVRNLALIRDWLVLTLGRGEDISAARQRACLNRHIVRQARRNTANV